MRLLVTTIVLSVVFTTTLGLKCYTCSNDDDDGDAGDCADEFSTSNNQALLQTCQANETFCRKRKTGVNNVYTNVERGCANQCEEQNIAYVDRVVCCQSDGCNTASLVGPTVTLLAGSVFLLVLRRLI